MELPVSGTFFKIKVFVRQIDLTPVDGSSQRHKHFGGNTAVVRPVPIPNTAVKRCRADGSSPIGSARVGRRQFFNKKPEKISSPAFLFYLLCSRYEKQILLAIPAFPFHLKSRCWSRGRGAIH